MPKSLLLIASLIATLAAPAHAADSYTIDTKHTLPVFEIKHLGFSTQRGRFNKTEGKISLDIAARRGSVELTIDAASIDMGLDKWDEHMRSEDYFDTARFPTMSFKSDSLIFAGDQVVGADGTFTLRGISKPLKLTVSGFVCAPHPFNKQPMCAGDVSATLKRSEFGMTKSLATIGDEVRLLIPVEAVRN